MQTSFLFFLLPFFCCYLAHGEDLSTLYKRIHSHSVRELFTFYSLYPQSIEGKKALKEGWKKMNTEEINEAILLSLENLHEIISLVHDPFMPSSSSTFSLSQVEWIEKMTKNLPHKHLKGHRISTKKELHSLHTDEVDIARAILIEESVQEQTIRKYEALLDIMTLYIKINLSEQASIQEKIFAINHFIFFEMGYRFPPHSLYAKNIDLYTFLPSVIEQREGVCLGVSILYLSLAQRLNLPLEIITPPGHIYLRSSIEGDFLNIETTARGVHLPTEIYQGLEGSLLQKRTLKETVGLALMNKASVFFERNQYQEALNLYKQAKTYLPQDPLLKLLTGYQYLFLGKTKKGKKLLSHASVSSLKDSLAEDFLEKKIDLEGMRIVFQMVDQSKISILDKQKKLQASLKLWPKFREGWFQLGITYLQLDRKKEALDALLRYHDLDPTNATVDYYLAILFLERMDYIHAWSFFHKLEGKTLKERKHSSALENLKRNLLQVCPEIF